MAGLENFHFLRPWALLALPLLGLIIALFVKQQSAANAWQKVCDAHLLEALTVQTGGRRRRYPLALLAIAWVLAVVALAGPVWQQLPQQVFRAPLARVILLDLSTSMNATDVSPSRLARAKFKLRDILARSREGQTALIVFAGEPFVVAPLTEDTDTIANMIPALEPGIMPAPGSRPDLALKMANALLEQAGLRKGQFLLITDGIDDVENVAALAAAYADNGRETSILAVGTADGAPIPAPRGGFVTDNQGAIVIPQMNTAALQVVARDGGGRFATLTVDDSDLDILLAQTGENRRIARATETQRHADIWREEGPWLLLAVIPLAALGFRRGWLVGLFVSTLIVTPPPARAWQWDDLWSTPDQQGAASFDKNQHAKAAELFEDPMWKATAYYRAGNYLDAARLFAQDDSARAHFNRGNALAHLGRFKEAIAAYDEVLRRHPDDEDARFNKELLQSLMDDNPPSSKAAEPDPQTPNGRKPSSRQESTTSGPGDPGRQTSAAPPSPDAGSRQPDRGDSRTAAQNNNRNPGHTSPGDSPPQSPAERGNDDVAGRNPDHGGAAGQPGETPPASPQHTANGEAPGQTAADRPAQQVADANGMTPETRRALEQWLRRIPDDPGGLLRRKFIRDYRQREHEPLPEKTW